MAFVISDILRRIGRIEFYEFSYGNFVFRYNTTANEVIVNNLSYLPMPLTRESITLTSDIRRSQLAISAPSNFEVANIFKTGTPALPVLVVIKAENPEYTPWFENIPPTITEWTGRVVTVEWYHSGTKLICESYYTAIQGNANMRYYGYSCPHMLFGERCKVNKNNYITVATVESVNGTRITSSAFAAKQDGYFSGGFLVYNESQSGLQHKRHINSHTGNTIILASQIIELSSNKQVEVYPGCDHTLATCKDKFGNNLNFGGFPWIPGRNPFTTTSPIF